MSRPAALAALLTGFALVFPHASGAAPTPPARAVVLDTGAAMRGAPISAARAAARELLAGGQGAPVALVTAGRHASLVLPPTRRVRALDDAVSRIPVTSGRAHLLEGVRAAITALGRTAAPSAVIVVISSGQIAPSTTTFAALEALARRAHVTIDAAGTVPAPLARLASSTGGITAPITAVSQLRGAVASIDRTISAAHGVAPSAGGGAGPAVPLAGAALLALVAALLLFRRRGRQPNVAAQLVASWTGMTERDENAVLTAAAAEPLEAPGRRGHRMDALAARLEEAGITRSAENFLLRAAGAGLGLALLGMVIAGPLAALVGPVLVALAVRWHVRRQIKLRRHKFAEQLGDTIQAIGAAMRAGHGLSSAIAMIAEDAGEPIATELRRIVSAERLGVPLDDALEEAVHRTHNRDLAQLALVAVLQREVGGNGAEALDRIVDTVRARDDVRRLVRTLTAQGQISRWVLTVLPIAIVGLLTVIGGSYMHHLYGTGIGRILLVVAAAMVAAGSFWIKKIVEIEV